MRCVSYCKSVLGSCQSPLTVSSSPFDCTKLCSSPVFSSVLCVSHLASVTWLLAFLHIVDCIVASFSLLQPDLSWSPALTVATSFALTPSLQRCPRLSDACLPRCSFSCFSSFSFSPLFGPCQPLSDILNPY